MLQVQARDLNGFVEAQRQLLTTKSNNRQNWMAFAVSLHLAGDNEQALKVMDTFEGTLEADREMSFEDSEMHLFKNKVSIGPVVVVVLL